MRLFIAIEFDEISEYIKDIQAQLPSFNGSKPKNFHLTLKFLGEVEEDKIKSIKDIIKKIKFQSLNLTTSEIGFFPSENYINVIWLGLKNGDKVIELHNLIDSLLPSFPQDIRFHPHITLARVKFIPQKQEFVKQIKEIKLEPKSVSISSFKLVKSTLTPVGPIYETLEEYPLRDKIQ